MTVYTKQEEKEIIGGLRIVADIAMASKKQDCIKNLLYALKMALQKGRLSAEGRNECGFMARQLKKAIVNP